MFEKTNIASEQTFFKSETNNNNNNMTNDLLNLRLKEYETDPYML